MKEIERKLGCPGPGILGEEMKLGQNIENIKSAREEIKFNFIWPEGLIGF